MRGKGRIFGTPNDTTVASASGIFTFNEIALARSQGEWKYVQPPPPGAGGYVGSGIAATGGDIESSIIDNGINYRVHVFNNNGTLTRNASYNNITDIEYLVVGGGGASGSLGGGGAGGYRCSVEGEMSGGGASAEPKVTLTNNTISVVVGTGGASGMTNGNPSSITSTNWNVTSDGGGYGASNTGSNGVSGGSGASGGGSCCNWNGCGSGGGSNVAGQGYPGGHSSAFYGTDGGSGGGGAGAAGQGRQSRYVAPSGGNGVESNITGTPTYRAGGGGGSSITGQGGNGAGTPGLGNTGSNTGGGGTGQGATAGINGTVIIRYKI